MKYIRTTKTGTLTRLAIGLVTAVGVAVAGRYYFQDCYPLTTNNCPVDSCNQTTNPNGQCQPALSWCNLPSTNTNLVDASTISGGTCVGAAAGWSCTGGTAGKVKVVPICN